MDPVASDAGACQTSPTVRHALASLLGVVQHTIAAHAMIRRDDRVLVAVSGGPDSTGLLLALASLRRKLGIELTAAHVNHRLRGVDADADEACAAEAAARLAVSFVRCQLPSDLARGGNLEARARTLRYAALRALAAAHGCTRIATGHTLDDQAETVLMRLIRGSSGRGLVGVQPRRRDGVVRPLIDCRRAAVIAVLAPADLPYRFDASNRDPRFLRTHVRERLLPLLAELNPAIAEACANLAGAARAEQRVVADWAEAQLAAHAGVDWLDAEWLVGLAAGLRPLVVARWLRQRGLGSLSARHIGAVARLASGDRRRGETHLPGGRVVRRAYGRLLLSGEATARAPVPPVCEKPF